MDEGTVNLILTLQIEDLESLAASWKGKAIEGSALTDSQIAVELQKAELEKRERILTDLRMARSISRAVQDDGATVAILTAEERRSAQDREIAYRMSGQPYRHISNLPDCRVDEDILSRFGSLNLQQAGNEDDVDGLSCYSESIILFNEQDNGESSAWVTRRNMGESKGNGKAKNECVACSEIRNTL